MLRTAPPDRRAESRFEVVGPLWGSLHVGTAARIVEINSKGALLESSLAVASGAVGQIRLAINSLEVNVDISVCHTRPTTPAGKTPRFLIGVEFLAPPPILAALIAQSSRRPITNLSTGEL